MNKPKKVIVIAVIVAALVWLTIKELSHSSYAQDFYFVMENFNRNGFVKGIQYLPKTLYCLYSNGNGKTEHACMGWGWY